MLLRAFVFPLLIFMRLLVFCGFSLGQNQQMSLDHSQDTEHRPKKQFYSSLAWWAGCLPGLSMEGGVIQRQPCHQDVHPVWVTTHESCMPGAACGTQGQLGSLVDSGDLPLLYDSPRLLVSETCTSYFLRLAPPFRTTLSIQLLHTTL
jgi:hypothetical protein